MRTGRPSTYSRQKGDAICERIAAGEDVGAVLAAEGVPWGTLVRWRQARPNFATQYARARESSAEAWEHRAWTEAEKANDRDSAAAANVRVNTIKWMAAKRNPRIYGDKMLHTGADGFGPVEHKISFDWSALAPAELETLEAILAKVTLGNAVEAKGDE